MSGGPEAEGLETETEGFPEPDANGLTALMRESQAPRQELLSERGRWLRRLGVEGREELLFEFEVLLRGVERCFSRQAVERAGGGPGPGELRPMLLDVREALEGALGLSRRLLDPDSDQKFVFRRFVESQLTDDRQRCLLLEEELAQETPEESLGVLRQSFTALRVVATHLLELPTIPTALYVEVGTLATREVLLNRYVRPFRPLEFRLEYDRIPSVALLEYLRRTERPARWALATAWLALFRIWRCLESIPPGQPRRARVVFAVIRGEIDSLAGWLTGPYLQGVGEKRQKTAGVRMARRLREGMDGALAKRDAEPEQLVEQLRALVEEQVLALATACGVDTSEGFEALTSEVERAERLRRDLWVIATLSRHVAATLRGEDLPAGDRALEGLRRCLDEFESVGFLLLRFGDMAAVEKGAALVHEPLLPPDGRARRERMAQDCEALSQVAEATFTSVSRRAQLRAATFDRPAAEALRDTYLIH